MGPVPAGPPQAPHATSPAPARCRFPLRGGTGARPSFSAHRCSRVRTILPSLPSALRRLETIPP
jgi:hypothetical protein